MIRYPVGQGSQEELRERANHWECLRYTTNQPSYANTKGEGFPWTDCEAGFNARIHMPACWDGKNLDSPDHTSHTAYLSVIDNGKCPSTHPVTLLKILYEVTWDVTKFKARWNPAVEKWPFVWATGDATGYSWHGDFQNGWDVNVLQNAIDKCDNVNDQTGNGEFFVHCLPENAILIYLTTAGITEACPFFTMQSAAVAGQCKANPAVNEPVDGVFNRLPG
ncbi:hypothetical protein DXG03_005658 [Asterophora parasitica]|uniref:DUF1996 domain-containing protein n=1 Tax=Asterophora parasitica TaxID=117018 RepID=A0A9P7FZ84_9AGAR|nr:hypothetical protein DXG03_005658 [Asterophora parasitica]